MYSPILSPAVSLLLSDAQSLFKLYHLSLLVVPAWALVFKNEPRRDQFWHWEHYAFQLFLWSLRLYYRGDHAYAWCPHGRWFLKINREDETSAGTGTITPSNCFCGWSLRLFYRGGLDCSAQGSLRGAAHIWVSTMFRCP